MNDIEICEMEAEEYADRVAANGMDYDDAYEQKYNKCINKYKNEGEEPDEIDFN